MTHTGQPAVATDGERVMDFEAACREWMKGCSCATAGKPWECESCTAAFHAHLLKLTAHRCACWFGGRCVQCGASGPNAAASPYEGARGGVCQDCKWPNESKVAKTCGCMVREACTSGEAWDAHEREQAAARVLQRQGVPFSDPRYYE